MKALESKKALIIDDEPDICLLLSTLLKQRNIQSTLASSLFEAQKVVETGASPDIIFLDNNLPDGIGISYISKLKKAYPMAKVIMITAHDSARVEDKAMQEGADFFIEKPFPIGYILKTVDMILGN